MFLVLGSICSLGKCTSLMGAFVGPYSSGVCPCSGMVCWGQSHLMEFSGSWWRMARNPLSHGPHEFCLLVPAVLCLEVKNCQCALSLPWLVWLPSRMVSSGTSAQGLSLPAAEGMVLEVSTFQTTHFLTYRVKASGQSSGQVREILCSQAFLCQQCWSSI